MKVSACILTYKRDEILLESIKHLLASTRSLDEIIVIDNGGSTLLPAALKQFPQEIQLIQSSRNAGCENLNLGFKQASGDIIFCFDDDSYPELQCVEKAVRVFEEHPEIGMIGFNMIDPANNKIWADPMWSPNTPEPIETAFCPGCGLAFRNDSRLPNEMVLPGIISQAHELSMAAEIFRLGYEIWHWPTCKAYHPETAPLYRGDKKEMGRANQLRFFVSVAPEDYCALLIDSFRKKSIHQILRFKNPVGQNPKTILSELKEIKCRRPLERGVFQKFNHLFYWHLHPSLLADHPELIIKS